MSFQPDREVRMVAKADIVEYPPKWGMSPLQHPSENPQMRSLSRFLQLGGFVDVPIAVKVDMKFSEVEAASRSPEGFLYSLSRSALNVPHVLRHTLR